MQVVRSLPTGIYQRRVQTLLMFIASQIWSSAAQRHFNNKKQQNQYPDILKRKQKTKSRGCKDNFK